MRRTFLHHERQAMSCRTIGKSVLMSFLLCSIPAGFAVAQIDNDPITCGNYRTIHSKALGEDRTLLIRLPDDYGKSDKKYPVLYKLDGGASNFFQAVSAARYLSDWMDKVPDPIIVGVVNTDRNRDMGLDQKPDNFIQFIQAELIPFVDKNYRTSGFRILAGQSASSVFALYSFLKQPELFDAYILNSFGIGRPAVVSLFDGELKKSTKLRNVGRKYLFIANGKLDGYDPDGSKTRDGARFLESLKQFVSVTVLMKSKEYDEEGHVPFPSLYDGLKWIYSEEKAATK
jgi:uncharacterized protein